MDTVFRAVAPATLPHLGQPIVIENRPGAAGAIGTAEVARAPADGYTLLGTGSSYTVVPLLQKNLSFQLVDFAPVTRLTAAPVVLVVPSSLPAKSFEDLLRLARTLPGSVAYASTGIGTTAHLAGEIIMRRAGVELTHAPYRGPALPDLLAGRIQFMLPTFAEVRSLISDGQLRALAVGYDERLAALPDVPTLTQLGFAGVPASANIGVVVPADTPQDVRTKLEAAFRAAAAQPEIQRRLDDIGIIVVASSGAEYAALLSQEQARFAEVIRQANITLN